MGEILLFFLFGSVIIQQPSIVDKLPINQMIEPISLALELVGVAVIVYGALVSLAFLIQVESRDRKQAGVNQHSVKQQFTSRILTGLEFFIAADVLKTILNPTLQSLEIVAVIVAIRAALTFLLNRELREEEKLRVEGQKGLDAAEGKPPATTTTTANASRKESDVATDTRFSSSKSDTHA